MKSVLVTGGTVRLGAVIAAHLRACGYRVVTTSSRPASGADLVADFRSPDGVEQGWASACALLDGVPPDALVNNAALFTGPDAALDAVDFVAPRRLTELMSRRPADPRGCVVNILDATVPAGDRPRRSLRYCAAKTALREYTLSSAREYARTLRVNAVSPGPLLDLAPVSVREKAVACPLGRPRALDVARAVAFLIASDFVTGLDIPVDGGLASLRA